jgi:predicted oxidoreductase
MNWGKWGVGFSTDSYLKQIEDCLEIGINTFDHADIYGHYTTEAEFGQALKHRSSLRHQLQLITKCGICLVTPNRPEHKIKSYNTTKEHILISVENSLRNFNTDHIDLLLIHRPDPLMDPYEIAKAFSSLIESGKVKQVGTSNFTASQLSMLNSIFPVSVNQIEASILHTKPFYNGVTDLSIEKNISIQAWSPMGAGKITLNTEDEQCRRVVSMSNILGEKYGATFDQILLAWLMKHPANIAPVIGTTKIDRIKSAFDAIELDMTNEEWHMLLRASHGADVP